jgi:glutamyl-Q tRNA(Asp) synthetase
MRNSDFSNTYRGRFAPSPTGPLHLGSLVAALGSYLQARSRQGEWFVRIEDLDPPRELPGAADKILQTLERYGFEWDGKILYQSTRSDAYYSALNKLEQNQMSYACGCSRTEIAENSVRTKSGLIYPGTCRKGLPQNKKPRATRIVTRDDEIKFTDAIQGDIKQNILTEVGDFVIKRADGQFAYQLAVVIDDAEQGITEVVRGADLLHSTPRQIYLQNLLHFYTPNYAHLPVITNHKGEKLSKQTHAREIDPERPLEHLVQAMRYLGHRTPTQLEKSSLKDFWSWALENWDINNVEKKPGIMESPDKSYHHETFKR